MSTPCTGESTPSAAAEPPGASRARPAPMARTSTASTGTRIAVVACAVRVTPAIATPVSTTTAATPVHRAAAASSGKRYRPRVADIAATDAVLPVTKPQPATKPAHGCSCRRP